MCRHCTSCPASRRSSAATAESTPPDSATRIGPLMDAPGIGAILRAALRRCAVCEALPGQIRHEIERVTPAREVIVDAAQHHRAPEIGFAREHLDAREPQGADD